MCFVSTINPKTLSEVWIPSVNIEEQNTKAQKYNELKFSHTVVLYKLTSDQ